MHGRQWATDTLDIFEGFNPCPANGVVAPRFPAMERLKSLIKAGAHTRPLLSPT